MSTPGPDIAGTSGFVALMTGRGDARPGPDVYDELAAPDGSVRPHWQQFAEAAGDLSTARLDQATRHVAHQVHENGVSYNVYADSASASRPWNLDVLPAVVTADEWRAISAGVEQRARLANAMAADLYSARSIVSNGLVPPAVVFDHPGFLRVCQGVRPPGGCHVHVSAFDLGRDASGAWRVAAMRVQAPSGLGYALENRAIVSRLYPDALRALGVEPLAPFYDAIQEALLVNAPVGDDRPSAVLLTPGAFNETYFEHVFLARELGMPLVQGGDLTVRDNRVFLKTVAGLRPVHAIWRRVDDDYCDPLELRADSSLGVPGLVEAWRDGRVLVANALGLSPIEAPALSAFIPAICERLLGESLLLPSIQPGDSVTASRAPVWQDGRLTERATIMRIFALATGRGDYLVLPGGLCRVAGNDPSTVSMQRGGSSKDIWVMSDVLATAQPVEAARVARIGPSERTTTSRAAESLFWLGRYAERSENAARLLRLALVRVTGTDAWPAAFQPLLLRTCLANGLLLSDDLPASPVDRSATVLSTLWRALVEGISDRVARRSLRFNVDATVRVAGLVRDRLSSDNWRVLQRLADRMGRSNGGADLGDTLDVIDEVILSLVAAGGLETAHMTRDEGWRFLSLGRHLERLSFISTTIADAEAHGATNEPRVLEWLLELSDSLITYRARYFRRPEWSAVVELLLLDDRNPRSALFQVARLDKHVRALPGTPLLAELEAIDGVVQTASHAGSRQGDLFYSGGVRPSIAAACQSLALRLSDALTLRYFSHVYDHAQAVETR